MSRSPTGAATHPPRRVRCGTSRRRVACPGDPAGRVDLGTADGRLAADTGVDPVAEGHRRDRRPRPAGRRCDAGAGQRHRGRLVHQGADARRLGPAVLAGHVNWKGRRGTFFDLGKLPVGAGITVDRQDGSTAMFTVSKVEQYPKDRFPSGEVYGRPTTRRCA
ncbi:sortase [Micromonospora sp. M12]